MAGIGKVLTPQKQFIEQYVAPALTYMGVPEKLGEVSQKISEWAKANPEKAQVLGDLGSILGSAAEIVATVETAGALPAVAKVGIKGVEEALVKSIASAEKTFAEKAVKTYPTELKIAIEKGIRPSAGNMRQAGGQEKYIEKANQAVDTIVKNKPTLSLTDEVGDVIEGALPKTLNQFEQAIKQTKKTVFDKYNALTKATGEKGATVNTIPISAELAKIAENPVIKDLKPEIVEYATKRAEALAERTIYTPEQAQDAIKTLNQSLDAFYKSPSFDTASKAAVDSIIANNLRKSLDEIVEGATGSQYQTLKNQYAALKAIEKDVAQRALVEGRKNQKGLIDFTDIFSAGDVVAGLATMQPAFVAKGVIQKGIATWIKSKNSPDNIIKDMFEKAEKVSKAKVKLQPPEKPFSSGGTPETTTIKFTPVAPLDFQKAVQSVPPQYGLTVYPADEYATMKIGYNPVGVGYAVKPNGDIVSIFNISGQKGLGEEAIKQAIKAGGNKLDAFDGKLVEYYKKFGFKEYNRIKWSDEYAPTGWDYEKYGRPDIVFMKLD
jgi:hypothetical protein